MRYEFIAVTFAAAVLAQPVIAGNNNGIQTLFEQTIQAWRPLAEQGDADAQFRLGFSYQSLGNDYREAVKWYRKAAEQGYAEAQTYLGILYRDGNGVPQDDVLAHMWFNLAAAGGEELGKLSRNFLTKRMTPEQIAEAQRLAREWLAAHPQK